MAGLGLIAGGYLGNSKITSVSLITIAVGIQWNESNGFGINHIDIPPQYAGKLLSITNMFIWNNPRNN